MKSEYPHYYAFLAYKYVYSQMQVHDSLCDDELWDKCLEFAKRWEDWDKRSQRAYNMGGYDSFMEFIEIASHDEDELL
jgi:hypothetical protein